MFAPHSVFTTNLPFFFSGGPPIYVIYVNGKVDSGKSYLGAFLAKQLGRGFDSHTYYAKLEPGTSPHVAINIFRFIVAQVAYHVDTGHHNYRHDVFIIIDADMLHSPENRLRMFQFCNQCQVMYSQVSWIISV